MNNGEGCTCNAWNESECACNADWTPKELIDARERIEELTTALAAKTADFDRLCKDFDAHDAELKRIIAGLRADRPHAKPNRASTLPAPRHGLCNFEYWRIIEKPTETAAEFVARHMATPSVLISSGGEE